MVLQLSTSRARVPTHANLYFLMLLDFRSSDASSVAGALSCEDVFNVVSFNDACGNLMWKSLLGVCYKR